jgi:hypothetical protein
MQIIRDENVIDSRQWTGAKPSSFRSDREVVSLRVAKETVDGLCFWTASDCTWVLQSSGQDRGG